MKYLLAVAFAACLSTTNAQQIDLLNVPADTITYRLNLSSVEMRKAAWSRNTATWSLVFGGIFTMLAADQSAKVYSQGTAVSLGLLTAGLFVGFNLKGAEHDRRASRLLRF